MQKKEFKMAYLLKEVKHIARIFHNGLMHPEILKIHKRPVIVAHIARTNLWHILLEFKISLCWLE